MGDEQQNLCLNWELVLILQARLRVNLIDLKECNLPAKLIIYNDVSELLIF
jgi:hypothetical protein